METISNVATAAAKAVWGEGETHKEPVSGVKGDVSKGEPYDAGNLDTPAQEKVEESLQSDRRPEAESTAPSAAPKPANLESVPGDVTETPATTTENTREDAAATQKHTRDPGNVPLNAESITADAHHVDTSTPGPGSKTVLGDAPRPLETVAKNNGGDAGRSRAHEGASSSSMPEARSSSAREGVEGGASYHSENQSASKEGHSSTENHPAEEYVRTTGFAADGGDFDATKPGAGREADRLMEQKAMRLGEGSSHHDHGKDKPSLGERIKAKLHKH